jgi:hypothetical protein
MRRWHHLLSLLPLAMALAVQDAPPVAAADDVAFALDFRAYARGDVRDWLEAKGFAIEQDAEKPAKVDLRIENQALVIQAKAPALALLFYPGMALEAAPKVRLEWGVERFPQGASFEQGVNNEALMVYVFFGSEELPSGSWFIPDSPYFIGLFLCEQDRLNHPYVGKHFKQGGRYVCIDRPPPGATVTSEFDLAQAFKSYFGQQAVPPVTGISIEMDTSYLKGDAARAISFIRNIEFLR